MLKKIKNLLDKAKNNIKQRIQESPAFIATDHFQKRVLQRFQDEDLPKLERAIEKAFLKAKTGAKVKYTHPIYNVTVVGKKIGVNGFELITCWQREEDAE